MKLLIFLTLVAVSLALGPTQSVKKPFFPCFPRPDILKCKNNPLKLKCPKGQKIYIVSAFYGRSGSLTCPGPGSGNGNCFYFGAVDVVRERCHNRNFCSLVVNDSYFPDVCPAVRKYLRVRYRCCLPHVFPKCDKSYKRVLKIGSCKPVGRLFQLGCAGGCHSSSTYAYGSTRLNSYCSCCKPSPTKFATIKLKCTNGSSRLYRYPVFHNCYCPKCEPKKKDCRTSRFSHKPRVGHCYSKYHVVRYSCRGGCRSYSSIRFGLYKYYKSCYCCVPKYVKTRITLYCTNGKVLRTYYYKVTDCHCRPCGPLNWIKAVARPTGP